ncbi:TATA box-binding protein-associated factor RNA polymerase I subunit B isoform X2 [Adelges cooleyi]|uniref:TATA box-binding protein-associated factor RNA polymerase I subunit B isoform X2 n=1 Tax=Adelges cooleyi TaxID=133065 RepID=UPI00217F474B|nr:TATA box-binding protein-associated factor RNA polymerase I subunit B isoform X2 [Adelges cooleyi]
METVNCHVCDGTEYTLMNGAYVCNECGVQSTAMREEQVDFSGHLRTALREELCREEDHELVNSTQIDKPKTLLSWECFNLMLLGLTDEIIELGADPSLKIIVLQIWVRYLQVIEGAFTSKRSQKLPKLNTCIVNTDGEILYGIKNLKRKLLEPKHIQKRRHGKKVKVQSKRGSVSAKSGNLSDSMNLSQTRMKQSRRLRKIDALMNSTNVDTPISNDLSLLQRSTKIEKAKVQLSTLMKNAMKSMASKSVDLTDNSSKFVLKNMQKLWEKSKYQDQKNHLTIKKLISIIQLGLMINKDNIYISDLLRWIHEGHFHVNRVNLFLPLDARHSIPLSAMIRNTSRHALNLEFIMLLRYLHFKQLPNIDLQQLAVRFCEELQLPGFTKFVCKLLLLLPPNMEITTVLPDPEIKVMAYILFAAKILFCLDGSTEEFSSKFAEIINKSENLKEKLFNWNDYVTFIECRNAVVSRHNYLLHTDLYGGRIRNTELFINDWMMMQSSLPIQKRGQLNKKITDNAKVLFKALPKSGGPLNFRQIPNTTKPLAFTLQWIFENYWHELSERSSQILKQDFARTDISYLTNEERIKNLSQQCNVPIEISYEKPSHYVQEKKDKHDTTGPHCGKHILSTAIINVNLVNYTLVDNKIPENVHTAVKEKPNTIFLGKGYNYWSLHFKMKFLKDTSMAKVNKVFDEQLPDSFVWFMKQCRRVIDCKLTELYMELIRVEKNFQKLVACNKL